MAVLYRHIRLDKNEPFYVGIGKTEKRAYTKSQRNKIWQNIVNKTEYRVDILFDDLTWEEACEKEKEFIELYGREDLGKGTLCNLTDGGDGNNNVIYTKERLVKLSEWAKGRKHSQESKDKISEANRKRKLSDETKSKISKAHKGKEMKKETIDKIKETLKNRSLSQKHIDKLILANKKRTGFKHTDQTKEKLKISKLGTKASENTKKKMSLIHQKEPRVKFNKSRKKWYYQFTRFNNNFWIGSFNTKEEAQDAIDKWKIENEKSLNTF